MSTTRAANKELLWWLEDVCGPETPRSAFGAGDRLPQTHYGAQYRHDADLPAIEDRLAATRSA